MHENDGGDGDIERIVIYFEESHFHSARVPKLQEIFIWDIITIAFESKAYHPVFNGPK